MLSSRYQRCWMVTVSITVILLHISRNNEGEEKAAATVLKDGASAFPGPKKGYYFGTGPKGLGYYKDRSKPNPNNVPLAAPSSSSSLSSPSSWALGGSSNKSGLIFVDLGKFRRHERNKNLKDGAAPSSSSVSSSLSIHFLSSHSFRGNKPGMYFGKGEKGVGYYPLLRIDRSNRPDSLSTTAMGGRKAATTTAIEKKTNADTEFQNHLVDGKSSNTCGDVVITYDDTEERKLLIEKYKQRLAKLDDENHKEDNNKLQRKMQLVIKAERQTGSNQILRNGIKFPRSWEGFIEPEDALKQLRKHRGSDGMQKYRNLFIPLPVNMVPTFNGWMQGSSGEGEYGTGYYRDFYQELLLLAKQQHLEKNGTIKTIEQLKLEQILNKGEAKIMGIGSKRFMNLDADGNSVVHHAQTGGVCGTLPCNVQTIETTAPDGKKQLIVTGQYLSDEGVGLPMGPDKPEQGRIHPLANDVFDDVKALILKGDGTEQLNEDYYANQHDTRTPAQKKFDASSDGGKSYRERLEAYNKRLAHMTDFNDLFKITERTEAMGWHSDRNGIQHLNAFGANEGDIYRIKPEKGATAR
eukprot:jgi/Bigna1/86694/estExt_fgenesh1_pg.C_120274